MSYLQKLFTLLDKSSKRRLIWLGAFSIFVSSVETIGISAIMPFIDIVSNFEKIHTNQYYKLLFNFFGFEKDINFAICFGLFLIAFFIFRAGVNLFNSYVMATFRQLLYAQITKKLFNVYLKMPYQLFTKKNSSYLTKTIVTEASGVAAVFENLLLMISESLVMIFLYTLMLLVNWQITLIFTIILIFEVLFLSSTVSRKIKKLGIKRAKIHAKFYEILNRLFSNFKQIKLQDEERLKIDSNDFSFAIDDFSKVNISNMFLKAIPRIFLETSGFSLVIFMLVFFLYLNQSNISFILPTLSLFVLSLYRLLPSVNRIIAGYNELMYQHKSIDIVIDELRTSQEDLKSEKIKFHHKIELQKINFSYSEKIVLRDLSLDIIKGEKIAFIGESGSGKSSLLDLIIGLNIPNDGAIIIDDILLDHSNLQNWRSQIGYIPQDIYLFDGTIEENVCFGRELDQNLLNKVLSQANIFDFLQSKDGTKTFVGEGGIQLSGGQKQRIAIARALYGKPEILILDEATSSLDEKTENKIMNEIYQISNDKTLIVVAHRLSTTSSCDKIYTLENGLIKKLT
jgi:ATP-binding cassette, subfamily B, bacterial PglK